MDHKRPPMSSKIVKDDKLREDTMRVNLNKGEIKFEARLLKYRDKDTRQMIYFIPALQMTAYGATEEKAKEMLDFQVDEYFGYLLNLNIRKLEFELSKLGFKNVPYAHK